MSLVQRLMTLLALAPCAAAELQFMIRMDDLVENVACFDPATCFPESGSATLTHLATMEDFLIPIASGTPGGNPVTYVFVSQGDGILEPGAYAITHIEVPWIGPGFRYTFEWDCPMWSCFYIPEQPYPMADPMEITPADGCYEPPLGLEWDLQHYPDGQVPLADVYTVQPGDTLRVQAGMRITAEPWGELRVLGTLRVEGTTAAPVEFGGQAWQGIRFLENSGGRIEGARIRGAQTNTDGGALFLAPGSEVELDHCILHHNNALERGGGAFVSDGSLLRMRSCTVSHNSASGGGDLYVEAGGFATGHYNLVTFGTPQPMVCEDGPLYSNLQVSDVYPLLNPEDGTGWHCDPGYTDAAAGDFTLSYLNPERPGERNCVIDAATIEGDLDPDGTPMDMGALPIDQADVLQPARILAVADHPGDQGALLALSFAASPDDGAGANPVSMYTIWVRNPGSVEWEPTGLALGALGQPVYSLLIPTQQDSTADNGSDPDLYAYTFAVCAHSALHPGQRVFSGPLSGYSIDNLAPESVTGFGSVGFWREDTDIGTLSLDLEWDACPSGDFDHFELFFTDPDVNLMQYLGPLQDTRFTHEIPFLGNLGDLFLYTILAVDHTGNSSLPSVCESPVDPALGAEPVPVPGFVLEGNHPNPFNPSTTLGFSLAQPAQVSLRVYDLQGRMVRELVHGLQPAGRHERVFDAGTLASGLYIYRLQAGDRVQTRTMVLLR
jgi:hypothetical protein